VQAWELAAREHIRELVARYNHAGDRGRVDAVVALFVPDGVLAVDGNEHVGAETIRSVLAAAAEPTPRMLRHFTSTLLIDVASTSAATSECYFQVFTEQGLDHWGRYRDTHAYVDDRWLFARRSVRVDGATPGGWAAGRGYPRHDAP
jgi:uncharacterized protein (TIGR02246 family)